MAHAVLTTGGTQLVAQDPMKPLYMPVLKILDLRLEKAFRLGPGKLSLIFDAFNLFNSQDVTNAYTKKVEGSDTVGQITGIVAPRKYRGGIMYTVLGRETLKRGECPALPLFFLESRGPVRGDTLNDTSVRSSRARV